MRWVPEIPVSKQQWRTAPDSNLEWLIRSFRRLSDWSRTTVEDVPQDNELYGRTWLTSEPAPKWATVPGAQMAGLTGTAVNFSVGTGITTITEYDQGYEVGEEFSAKVNQSAGTIEIPETGLYTIKISVLGEQGNSLKEESFYLWHRSTIDGDRIAATFQVATDKTPRWRQLSNAFDLQYQEGEVISLGLSATGSMGTFDFEHARLQIMQLVEGTVVV